MRDILTACRTKCRSKSWNKVGMKSILRNIMCKIEDADDDANKKKKINVFSLKICIPNCKTECMLC